MKKHAFTLIEILTVIAIIVILAGMLMAATLGVKNHANKVKAEAQISSLKMAISQYETTYNVLPFTLGQGTDDDVTSDDDFTYDNLLSCLDGSDANLNPRKIKFLEIDSDGDDPGTVGDFKDPWGNDFIVGLDLTYDGNFDASQHSNVSSDVNKTIIIFSGGKDGDLATSDDNITSW